jgi:hypothetical protein
VHGCVKNPLGKATAGRTENKISKSNNQNNNEPRKWEYRIVRKVLKRLMMEVLEGRLRSGVEVEFEGGV